MSIPPYRNQKYTIRYWLYFTREKMLISMSHENNIFLYALNSTCKAYSCWINTNIRVQVRKALRTQNTAIWRHIDNVCFIHLRISEKSKETRENCFVLVCKHNICFNWVSDCDFVREHKKSQVVCSGLCFSQKRKADAITFSSALRRANHMGNMRFNIVSPSSDFKWWTNFICPSFSIKWWFRISLSLILNHHFVRFLNWFFSCCFFWTHWFHWVFHFYFIWKSYFFLE